MLAMTNFAERYRELTDDQLLKIAASGDDLTTEAEAAFVAEIERRGFRDHAMELRRVAIEARKKKQPLPEPGFDPALLRMHADEIAAAPDLDPDKNLDLTVVSRFRDLVPAQLALGALRSAGIDVSLCDENMLRMDWLLSNAIGGLRLVVPRADVEAATAILEAPTPATLDAGTGETFEHPACPNCGSTETFFEELDQKWSRGSLYFVPLPIVRDDWHCADCGHFWKAPHD
jgi:hypothetical protein